MWLHEREGCVVYFKAVKGGVVGGKREGLAGKPAREKKIVCNA